MIICDDIGTYLGYEVRKKTIELGMEILLRVPHVSFVLQCENTVNFKVKYLPACMPTCLPSATTAAARATRAVVVVDDATPANAHANADADDACSDADESARCF